MAVSWTAVVAGLGPSGGSPSERTTAPGSIVGRTLRSDGGPSDALPQKSVPPVRRRLPPGDERLPPCAWPPPWRLLAERRLRLLPPPPPLPSGPGVWGCPPGKLT